jgi:hypothetical protein
MNRPKYDRKPIASIETLAAVLGIPKHQLSWLSRNAHRLYTSGPRIPKDDGTTRETVSPRSCLKDVQRRINRRIFDGVSFPEYLQGGIRDRQSRRDYVRNAGLHAGAKIVINEDIARFFPSVSRVDIRMIWLELFRFPPVVADLLTALTTYQGCLPQGAPTSSYLANLALYDVEPIMVELTQRAGWRYTRYVDDISLSAAYAMSAVDKQYAIGQIRHQCTLKGYRLKKSKHRIFSAARTMLVNGLVVNQKASLPRSNRAQIRAAVHELRRLADTERTSDQYLTKYKSALGRVALLARLHPAQGAKLKALLEGLRPRRL